MQSCSILFCIVAMIIAVSGNAKDFHVSVTPVQTRLAIIQAINVVLKYTNTGNDTIYMYKWYVPKTTLTDKLFEVIRDGKRVEYVGPVVKRRAPIPEDLVALAPGQSLSAIVPLSTMYNMTESGNYVIQYNMTAHHVLYTVENSFKRTLKSSNDDADFVLQSTPVSVFTAGHRNLLIEETKQYRTRMRTRASSYSGCSYSQINVIRNAMTAAKSYADDAFNHLTTMSYITNRYTTWFGDYTYSRHSTLASHFADIQNSLYYEAITFDCTCPNGEDSTYAYVYSSRHYNIYLCNQFWSASSSGVDTTGGTIIHELAHFQVVADTDDHEYGQSSAKRLARINPSKAMTNSDNLQYFAESTSM